MWVPDVYQGAPTPITLLIGTAPEFAAFAMILRLLAGALAGAEVDWQGMLVVLSVLSVTLGHVVAIAQTNLKRMLAYSTIANMGYVLMGFLAADVTGYSAAMFYMVAYVLTSLASFGMILLLSRKGFEADQIDDLKGLNARSPWWAFVMLLVMFSLAGMPPTIGFYAKLLVLQAAVKAGFVWLAIVGVLAALVGAFYYLRIVKLMYFDEPVDRSPIEARGDTRMLLSANGLALLLLRHPAAAADGAVRGRARAVAVLLSRRPPAGAERSAPPRRANIVCLACGLSCASDSSSPAWST